MPNVIKSSVSAQSLALKKGNFWIGVGDGKGLDWWTGIVPPSGGYTIYLDKATQGPSIYTAANDSQLISLTNSIGGQSFITAEACLNWFATQTDKMVFNIDYPAIVTDGLAMNIDASFTPSYPTINNVLYDVSLGGNNATLINGPTFGTTEGVSCFKLDGVDDYIQSPKDLVGFTHNIQYDINWTIECWLYMNPHDGLPQHYTSIYGNYNGCNYTARKGNAQGLVIYFAAVPAQTTVNFSFGPLNNPTGSQCPNVSVNWNNAESGWVAANINKWCHFVMTSDDGTTYKIYVNGEQQGSTKTVDFKNSQLRIDNNLTATSNYGWGGNGVTSFSPYDYAVIRMYNKPLSQTEIIQNYNAQKSRFGL